MKERWIIVMLSLLVSMSAQSIQFEERKGVQWSPVSEWSLPNASIDRNPFDISARVIFVHSDSSEVRKTEMFFSGEGTWRFRFTGTRPGRWSFTTESKDSDLDGHSGSILVEPNDHGFGFVKGLGGKWVRDKGRKGTPKAFVPQYVMYSHPASFDDDVEKIDKDIQIFIREHGFSGFHVPVYCRWFDLAQDRSNAIDSNDPNPDLETFAALESFIIKVHAAGGVVHLWAWGDESRRQTPVKWGINDEQDRRLQRYIGARLGPLPGWTMGYGFDLDEWVTEAQLSEWRDYLQAHLGWGHMLGGRHGDPNHGIDHSSAVTWNEGLDYSSYEHHRPTPAVYAAALEAIPGKPVFSEDRFRIRQSDLYRAKDYTEAMTRRGLWHSSMAGGVANIWGKLDGDMAINMGFGASNRYEHPEWIKTWSIFFHDRFDVDMSRLLWMSDGLLLGDALRERVIVYCEEATRIRLNLTTMPGPRSAVAVDTKKPYLEVAIGLLENTEQVWTAPYQSDWAIAIGGGGLPYPKSSVIKGMHLDWSSHKRGAPGSDNFALTWSDDNHLYGAWGDGGGFRGTNGKGRVGLGVARIEGDGTDFSGTNLWGGFEPQAAATFDGKSWGMLSVRGSLYMWVVPDKPEGKSYRNHYEYVELAKSDDHGLSWEKADWRFNEDQELTIPTFLNIGQDYAGIPEEIAGYVYSYFISPQSPTMEQQGPEGIGLIVHKPGKIYLARVPIDSLMKGRDYYEFYQGINLDGSPRWGRVEEKRPVFEDKNGVGWCLSVSYNPVVGRYILCAEHGDSSEGTLGFFDAPKPWGPWTTVEYYNRQHPFGAIREGSNLAWQNNVFFAAFPTKWLDDERFTMNFTGAGRGRDNDSFNTVRGRFERY